MLLCVEEVPAAGLGERRLRVFYRLLLVDLVTGETHTKPRYKKGNPDQTRKMADQIP